MNTKAIIFLTNQTQTQIPIGYLAKPTSMNKLFQLGANDHDHIKWVIF